MQIQAAGAALSASLTQGDARTVRVAPEPATGADEVPEDNAPAPPTVADTVESAERPGVLRLLQEGHFKGVAGVRLRIVHADRIAALEAEQARSAVTDASGQMASTISSAVTDLAEASESVSVEQANAAIEAFDSQVGEAIDSSFASGELDAQVLESQLSAAFDSLVGDLGLRPTEEDVTTPPPGAELDGASVSIESDQSGRDFLAELSEIFFAELAKILASAENLASLAPISEPEGNGRAFEKFLAMYDEVRYAGNDSAEPAAVEVVA